MWYEEDFIKLAIFCFKKNYLIIFILFVALIKSHIAKKIIEEMSS